jgi:hypothetical protein
MLFLVFYYVLAAVLVFQGVHLLGEREAPMGVVPAELGMAGPGPAWFGRVLTAFGICMAAAGLGSLAWDGLMAALGPLRNVGLLLLAAFALRLVFGRKVDYLPGPLPAASDHH